MLLPIKIRYWVRRQNVKTKMSLAHIATLYEMI